MPPNRHQATPLAADKTPGEGQIDDCPDTVLAKGVLGHAHAPDEDRCLRRADHLAERPHGGLGGPAQICQLFPRLSFDGCAGDPDVPGVGPEKIVVEEVALEHVFEGAVQESDIPSGIDQEGFVGQLRPEQSAFRDRRNPVPLHAGLAVGVDEHDFRPGPLSVIHVLRGNRLIVGGVGADEDEDVSADPVAIRAGGRAGADRLLERDRARGMANPGGVVDRIGPHCPNGLLGGVVGLVRGAPAGEVEPETVWMGSPNSAGNQVQGVIPRHPRESGFATPTHHRVRQAAEPAQLRARRSAQ